MEKSCFIIMPITDSEPYKIGHFKRVYEYIIKPSCINAGFQPIRADDVLNTNYIAIDVIKQLVTSEMALCDLSSKNPNVLYELGIRQAFNLPVTLIRDSITGRVFDVQGFRDIEYDENLRIDTVEGAIDTLTETILNTYKAKGQEINSLISLLSIHPAKISNPVEISTDTELILDSIKSLWNRISQMEKFTSPNQNSFIIETSNGTWQDLTTEEMLEITVGDIIEHRKFGKGVVTSREGGTQNPIIAIQFESGEIKKIMSAYAKLRKLIRPT